MQGKYTLSYYFLNKDVASRLLSNCHKIIVAVILFSCMIISCTPHQEKHSASSGQFAALKSSAARAARLTASNPDSALAIYYFIVGQFDHRMDDSCRTVVANACLDASSLLVGRYNYTEAMSLLAQGLSICSSLNNPLLEVRMLNNYATIHLLNQNFAFAEHIYNKANQKLRGIGDKNIHSKMLANLITVNVYLGQAQRARYYLKQYKALDVHTQQYLYNRILLEGCVWRAWGDYQRSVSRLRQARQYAISRSLPAEYECDALKELANTYHTAGDTTQYVATLQQLYDIALEKNVEDEQLYALRILSVHYDYIGDRAKADALYARTERLSRKIFNPTDFNRINGYYAINEYNELNDEIALLKSEKLLEQERSRMTTIVAVVIGVSLILALVALLVIIKQKRRLAQSYRILYEMNVSQDKADAARLAIKITEEQTNELVNKIRNVLDTEEELCAPDFSIARLAELVESNSSYVSKIINDIFHVNFRTLVNERRIRLVCRRMEDDNMYGCYTLRTLAESVGFRSMSTFNTAFKKVTKTTPSMYMKEMRLHHESESDEL